MKTTILYDTLIDEYILDLGEELCEKLGWRIGDTLEWIDNGNGTYTVKKVSDNET